MVFILDLFGKPGKSDDAKPTSEKCRVKIDKGRGPEDCGGTIFIVDGKKECGDKLAKHPGIDEEPPP